MKKPSMNISQFQLSTPRTREKRQREKEKGNKNVRQISVASFLEQDQESSRVTFVKKLKNWSLPVM